MKADLLALAGMAGTARDWPPHLTTPNFHPFPSLLVFPFMCSLQQSSWASLCGGSMLEKSESGNYQTSSGLGPELSLASFCYVLLVKTNCRACSDSGGGNRFHLLMEKWHTYTGMEEIVDVHLWSPSIRTLACSLFEFEWVFYSMIHLLAQVII